MRKIAFSLMLGALAACRPAATSPHWSELLQGVESIGGNRAYLASPFATAGDRLYLVGYQDGSFPALGWHLPGEMGGIWAHPVKLFDGFSAELLGDTILPLAAADSFVNYPFAGRHFYHNLPGGLRAERLQFVPDGKEALAVAYLFHNPGPAPLSLRLRLCWTSDLRPTWLGERTGMLDGPDRATWDAELGAWVFSDSLNEWHALAGSPSAPAPPPGTARRTSGHSQEAVQEYPIEIPAGGNAALDFVLAGSAQSLAEAQATYRAVASDIEGLLRAKKSRYEALAARTRLRVPEPALEQAFRWLAYNTDWLTRDVPGQGRGLSAGLPDYPWWFGADNAYALQGAICTGHRELAYQTIDLLREISEKTNGNGRVLHEVSTNGAVFNPGNVNETPQFASLIWKVYRWTGDRDFLQKNYPFVKKGLEWLLRENDRDGNLLPDGFGMMEIHGLNSEMIDVAAYTQKAFADFAEMAAEMGEDSLSAEYARLASLLRKKINSDFWAAPYASYADFIGSPRQALSLIRDAKVRADTLRKPWALAELNATEDQILARNSSDPQPFVLYHNWVVNTPMETGAADSAQAILALETARRFVNPYGMFVTGIDRDESAGQDEGSFAGNRKVFSYTGAVMTLPTGVQAVAENQYGRPDQALDYLRRMTRSFSYAHPGSMYEVSPDYGMFVQAWNLYAFAVPIVEQFFGIQPRAADRQIRIQPQMPSAWSHASLDQLPIGGNVLSVAFCKLPKGSEWTIRQQGGDELIFALPASASGAWRVNGKEVQPAVEGAFQLWKSREQALTILVP
jgi:glycogen debranching enzyme